MKPMSIMLLTLLLSSAMGCTDSAKPKAGAKSGDAPAEVAKPDENNLAIVTLTPKAVERLGITIAEVERRPMPRTRSFGGDLMIPPGNTLLVKSPVTGMVIAPASGIQAPGSRVEATQEILTVRPMLTPEREVLTPAERVQMANARASLVTAQLMAEGEAQRSLAQVAGAKIDLQRAEQLLRDSAGSQRDVDTARVALSVAQETLKAAQERKLQLDKLTLDSEAGQVSAIPIMAGEPGVIRALNVANGQTVSAGDVLFEIVNLQSLWVRVPVYVGQIDTLDLEADAIIGDLEGSVDGNSQTARPVTAPPTADALSSTGDVYYVIDNPEGQLRPGQRVGVQLALKGEAESLVVPAGAVLHDIHGGAWVYQVLEENKFRRHRVMLLYSTNEFAVLTFGPAVGTKVIVDGIAEVFGTEFGTGK